MLYHCVHTHIARDKSYTGRWLTLSHREDGVRDFFKCSWPEKYKHKKVFKNTDDGIDTVYFDMLLAIITLRIEF